MKFLNTFSITLFMAILLGSLGACNMDYVTDGMGGFDKGGNIGMMEVTLEKPGYLSGDRFINLVTGDVFDLDDASKEPENIDFVFLFGSSSGLNFITPAAIERLSEWGTGTTMNNKWLTKNKATMFKLEESAEANTIFERIETGKELREAYQNVHNNLSNTADKKVYGPGLALRDIQNGDVLFFHSEARNFYAVIKVVDAKIASAGSVTLDIKLDKEDYEPVAPADTSLRMNVYAVTLDSPAYKDGNRCLDFSTGNVYNWPNAPQQNIDLIFFNGSSTNTNFVSPSDEGRLKQYTSGKNINNTWLVKNEGNFIRIAASDLADSIYSFTINTDMISQEYNRAEQKVADNVAGYISYGANGTSAVNVSKGDVILFKSVSRNIYAMAQVTDRESGGKGSVTLKVKVDNSEKVDIAPPPNRYLEMFSPNSWKKARYIDLESGVDYDLETAQGVSENIDLIFANGSGTKMNLYPPSNESAIKAWSSKYWPAEMVKWDVINDAQMIDLGDDASALALYNGLEDGDSTAIADAFYDATKTPSKRMTHLLTGDIVLFHSISRDFYAAIKVVYGTNDGDLDIRFKISNSAH